MFLNTYGSDMDDYVSTFNSSQVLRGNKNSKFVPFVKYGDSFQRQLSLNIYFRETLKEY